MREGRWTTVTESEFDHERRGLETIRKRLPDADPWYAWANFTFTAATGHVRQVDLLVITPGGVHMVELKHWHGRLTSERGTWVQTTPGGSRVSHGNPLHLVDQKAKELAGLLAQNGVRVWVGGEVCITSSGLRMQLPVGDQHGVHTTDELVRMLHRPARDDRRRIDGPRARAIKAALDRIGIRRSDAEFKVGPYLLERRSFETGPTWADYLARHSELHEMARVRIYLSERGSDASIRKSVENAARREAAVLQRFRHPGVVQLRQYDPSGHSAGPALIFDYHPDTLRLDEYLVRYGDRLDVLGRMALVRQLAETIRSAHASRIHHRALAANAVHVIPRPRRRGDTPADEDARWLSPIVQISDWQIATQRAGSAGSTRFAPTSLSAIHLSDDSDAYLAPELTAVNPDPVALDVYGLGVLTYLLATGQPPAASQAELLARLEAGQGLRPSAIVDGLSEDIDELVQAATAYDPGRRLSTVDEFLDMLECVEDWLTTPSSVPEPEPAPAPEKDPLDAVPGDVLAGRWEVRRRLGTGSTSRALLVRDRKAAEQNPNGRSLAVLKVALSDARAAILAREAEIMRRLRAHSGMIRLVEPEPLVIGGRTALALEYVGDERVADDQPGKGTRYRHETVARQLREQGRLQIDQLEAYGDYLFGAVDFLEGEGVWHRDIKPDNIAIRVRPNRTRELVLIDFSLAGFPVQQAEAGTEGYLDPFIGGLTRSVYDAHAERYAVAVTLHQMASGELPKWGDGKVSPRQLDPDEWPYPTIAADAFDPAIRDALVAFFRKALHRDAAKRFRELKPMRDAWRKIFLELAETAPSTGHPSKHGSRHPAGTDGGADTGAAAGIADAEPESAQQQRDKLAARATRDTHLSAAGLTPAAESFLYGLGITTVGELLDYSQRNLVNAPGLGAKTRSEIQSRQRQWAERLGRAPKSPLTPEGRKAAATELDTLREPEAAAIDSAGTGEHAGALAARTLRTVSLDALATLFVPKLKADDSNRNEVESTRLLLRLPDDGGALPGVPLWPTQTKVAEPLGISQGHVSKILGDQRKRWRRLPAVKALREEVLELLADLGRIASAVEIAEALVLRRGTRYPDPALRGALGLAAVRVVVETEQADPENRRFTHQPNRDADGNATNGGLLALEVGDDDAPDTPSAPGLLDYAQSLGRKADKLARLDALPTASTVLNELGAVPPPSGTIDWDERRLVAIAVAAAKNAAATPRLEIYPRDLPLVRALRLTQAGLVRWVPELAEKHQPGLPTEDVHKRVLTRFPQFNDDGDRLPTGAPLTKALREAGFDLTLSKREDTGTHRYLPTKRDDVSDYIGLSADRRSTRRGAATRYSENPDLAAAGEAEERLDASAHRDGFRVLTVRAGRSENAVIELATRFDAEPLSMTALFLTTMHDLIPPNGKPTWETILRADIAEPGTRAAAKFSEYVRTAWGRMEPVVRERLAAGTASGGPLLLTDATVFARYQAMGVLTSLAETARLGGRGLWLLCPQNDPFREPRLATQAIPYQEALGEWIRIPDSWVENQHRAA
ncbi:BREX system serine/threonine kinase PglW [Actinomadura kijaniata]|uniref:Serine/threonine protein kinase n=1 Tax=Actinomadura namibiensis TaxID=182080 RepID=A0A7W3LIF3_ACTNM|nr:BREX system serine/threonine kinase PglW [Actinomadura namibiensis]MBA8948724.1 serine/threonine protein kinase [Actinomadura namibiensis]